MTETAPASSPRMLRAANAQAILELMWDSGPVTGTDLMASTGLTRATVHGVCDELIERGWVKEVENQREHGPYAKGRPARRYEFRAGAGVVLGVDAGEHRVTATATDLRGTVLGRSVRLATADDTSDDDRRALIDRTILGAVTAAGVTPEDVLAVAVGVPAPVDGDGRTDVPSNAFWEHMNPDLARHLSPLARGEVLVENDANLAALAEGWRGGGQSCSSFVTLLTGERLGAGVVGDGQLLRGRRGGAGEMRYLDLVEGVGSAVGIAALAREWTRESIRRSPPAPGTPLAGLGPDDVDAEAVFAAAGDGDPLAADVLKRLGARLSRVVATLAILLDTDRIILAGAVAHACEPLVEMVRRDLPQYFDPPAPEVVTSTLGDDVVCIGAVRRALDHVRAHALTLEPPRRSRPPVGTPAVLEH